MSLPKKLKYNIDINPPKIGTEFLKYGDERIKKLLADTDPRTKYIPQSIMLENLDESVYNLVNDGELTLFIDGEKVPVFYMDNERWGEFSKTWKFTDDDKNIKTPYITVRRIDKKQGTRINKKYQIPQQMKHKYINVPIHDNGELIYLVFKTPEPVNIDLSYEIQLFTKYRIDVNTFDELIFKKYSSGQLYCFPKNNPMPTLLTSSEEPRNIESIEGDKCYVAKQTIQLFGFIQDENDIEITKTTRKPRFGIFLI